MLSKILNNTLVQGLVFGAVVGECAYLQQKSIVAAAKLHDEIPQSAYTVADATIPVFTAVAGVMSVITFVCGKAAYAAFAGSNTFAAVTALATVGAAVVYNNKNTQKMLEGEDLGSITLGSLAALLAVGTGAAVAKVAEMVR